MIFSGRLGAVAAMQNHFVNLIIAKKIPVLFT
jgi:hypothetical protein